MQRQCRAPPSTFFCSASVRPDGMISEVKRLLQARCAGQGRVGFAIIATTCSRSHRYSHRCTAVVATGVAVAVAAVVATGAL